jgi:hypothetical protein
MNMFVLNNIRESPNAGGAAGGVSANDYRCTYTGAQINFGDLKLHI